MKLINKLKANKIVFILILAIIAYISTAIIFVKKINHLKKDIRYIERDIEHDISDIKLNIHRLEYKISEIERKENSTRIDIYDIERKLRQLY
jgi:predicted PurR-regulated permease PerM